MRFLEYSSQFTNLFFEQMVPEWSLAIFMEKFSMTRKDAVEKIQQQNQHHNNHVDDSQSLFITQNSLDEEDWRTTARTIKRKKKWHCDQQSLTRANNDLFIAIIIMWD